MSLTDLYGEILKKHHQNPLNFGEPKEFTEQAEDKNPLCGDVIHVYVQHDKLSNHLHWSFTGKGCAICVASASMMTDYLNHTAISDLNASIKLLFGIFNMDSIQIKNIQSTQNLGDLTIFQILNEFPARQKCATLPWKTAQSVLEKIEKLNLLTSN